MSVIKIKKHEKNFSIINHSVFEIPNLSWKAKGMWGYLITRKDDWKISVKHLAKHFSMGRDGVLSGLKELMEFGLCSCEEARDNQSRYTGMNYIIYEVPQTSQPPILKKRLPQPENPVTENPLAENPDLLRIDISKEEKEVLFVAEDPGGPPLEKIKIRNGRDTTQEITQSDLFRLAIVKKKDWKTSEISKAWEILAKYKNIVYDWFRFIEGTIEKFRNAHKSIKASESAARKNTNKEKSSCNKNQTPQPKTCNEPSLEKDTQVQPSPRYEISILDLLDKSRAGLRDRPATS